VLSQLYGSSQLILSIHVKSISYGKLPTSGKSIVCGKSTSYVKSTSWVISIGSLMLTNQVWSTS